MPALSTSNRSRSGSSPQADRGRCLACERSASALLRCLKRAQRTNLAFPSPWLGGGPVLSAVKFPNRLGASVSRRPTTRRMPPRRLACRLGVRRSSRWARNGRATMHRARSRPGVPVPTICSSSPVIRKPPWLHLLNAATMSTCAGPGCSVATAPPCARPTVSGCGRPRLASWSPGLRGTEALKNAPIDRPIGPGVTSVSAGQTLPSRSGSLPTWTVPNLVPIQRTAAPASSAAAAGSG